MVRLSLFHISPLSLIGLSKTNDPEDMTPSDKHQDIQPIVDPSEGDGTGLPILRMRTLFDVGRFPIEVFRKGKVDAVLGHIGLSFEVVPFVYHMLTVHTIMKEINSEGAPTGLPKERLTVPLLLVCAPDKTEFRTDRQTQDLLVF